MTNIGSDEYELNVNYPRKPSEDSTNTTHVINEQVNKLYIFFIN